MFDKIVLLADGKVKVHLRLKRGNQSKANKNLLSEKVLRRCLTTSIVLTSEIIRPMRFAGR